jgi:hypothetical protein
MNQISRITFSLLSLLLLILLSIFFICTGEKSATEKPLISFTASYTSIDDHTNNHNVKCLSTNNHTALTCLPSLIIAGTQKSGTTALAALLSLHPYLSFAPKKEVHFFDKYDNYKQGIRQYAAAFRPWTGNYSHEDSHNETSAPMALPLNTIPLFAEATPFCK